MTVLASASGTRIDCNGCGEHKSSRDLTIGNLRPATGYARVDVRDYRPSCAAGGNAIDSP